MRLPSLFIFDMDGLLLDSERAFMHTLSDLMAEYGYVMTREAYEETLGLSTAATRGVMTRLFGEDFPYEKIYKEGRLRQNRKAAQNPLPVKPGIRELLAWIQAQGIPACVASSSPRRTVEIYLSSADLLPFFDFIASGDDITHSKPDPEIFLLCCRHFDISPENALVLEDSENGILAAANGGIPVICIPDMKIPRPEILAHTARVCRDAHEATALLRNSSSNPAFI